MTAPVYFSCAEPMRFRIVCPKGRWNRRRNDWDFTWTDQQVEMRERLFLRRKWVYDASAITAYGVNMRLWRQRRDKRLRTPKRG